MTILISGTTNGIGYATARALYAEGHELIMVNRNAERAEAVKKQLETESESDSKIYSFIADFADLNSVLSVCKDIAAQLGSIDVLINNAGLFCDTHSQTVQGFEMTIGVNYLASVLFTRELLPLLKAGKRGRIITVSSRAALFGKIRKKKFFKPGHPAGFIAYSASKLAVLLWCRSLAEALEGIDVIAVHPGEVASNIWKGDSFFMKMMSPIVKKKYQSIEEGAETSVYLAQLPDVSHFSGCFIEKRDHIIQYNKRSSDNDLRSWLNTETAECFTNLNNAESR